MPINVFNIENLFWSNSSYKVPNTLPTLEPTLIKSSPVILDFFSGYIDLYGDYNYCEYKGVYYILKKKHPLDLNKNHWNYVLIRDVWVNLLTKGNVRVKGYAVTWNDDKLLEKHINKCVSSLDEPHELTHLNFEEKIYEWRADVSVTPGTYDIPAKVLGRDGFMHAKAMINGSWGLKYTIAKKFFYKDRPELFIFGSFAAAQYKFGWKHRVLEKINESLKDFSDQNKAKDRIIVKATSVPSGSPLRHLYAVSYREGSIGAGEEAGMQLSEINLSGLKDIAPIRWDNLKQPEPNKPLTEETGTFPVRTDDLQTEEREWIWKLCRKGYLPLVSSKNWGDNYLKPQGGTYASHWRTWNWFTEAPQTLTLNNSPEKGYLWWVDRLDFVLAWPYPDVFLMNTYHGYSRAWVPQDRKANPAHWVIKSFPVLTSESDYYMEQIRYSMNGKPPAYGFLMYQTERNYEDWDAYEYTGAGTPIRSLPWYSGLSESGFTRYSDPKHWFNNIPDELARIAGNATISKMHLDLNNFTWLYFAPKSKDYHYAYDYQDGFKHWSFVNNNYYTIRAVNSDIYKDGKVVRENPYKSEKYTAFDIERRKVLRKITIVDDLTLPWEIAKGDYFFSSLEYEFRQYKGEEWSNDEATLSSKEWLIQYTVGGGTGFMGGAVGATGTVHVYNILQNRSVLEDFYTSDPVASTTPIEKRLVLCNNKAGGLEFRILESFSHLHTLSHDKNQIVHSVDGNTSKQITYYKLTKHGLASASTDKEWDNYKITEFLYLFYKAHGYSVSVVQDSQNKHIVANWLWYDDEDLNSEAGLLFDLVGTSWYAYLRKDKVHLICKREEQSKLFSNVKRNVSILKDEENKKQLSRLSVTAKVNQKNVLSILTKPFFLKTKFLFHEGEKFNVSSKAFDAKDIVTSLNSYLITAKNPFDLINEWIHVPKKVTGAIDIPTQIEQDRLRLEIQRAREDFNFYKGRDVDLAYQKHQTAFERVEWDINYANLKAGFNLVESFIPSVSYRETYNEHVWPTHNKKGIFKGLKGKKNSNFSRTIGGTITNLPFNIASYLLTTEALNPELSKRARVDLEYATKDVAYQDFYINVEHFRRKQNALLQLNAVSNVHQRGEINDLELIEAYNKENNLNDINLRVYTPTEQQLVYLEEFREEFGVDCYIPDVNFEIHAGMPPNIVRLLKIEDDGILGVENVLIREILKNRLEAGIKIVDVTEGNLTLPKEPAETIDVSAYVQEIKELHEGTTLNQQQIDALEAELENEKKERKDDVRKLKKDLVEADEKLRNAAEAAKVLDQENKKCQEELEACSKRVEALKEFSEGADKLKKIQEDLNVANNRIEQDRGKIQVLEDEKKELEDKNQEQEQKIAELITKKEELEGQIVTLAATKRPVAGYTKEQVNQYVYCWLDFFSSCLRHGISKDFVDHRSVDTITNFVTINKSFWTAVVDRVVSNSNPYYADTKTFAINTLFTTELINFVKNKIQQDKSFNRIGFVGMDKESYFYNDWDTYLGMLGKSDAFKYIGFLTKGGLYVRRSSTEYDINKIWEHFEDHKCSLPEPKS